MMLRLLQSFRCWYCWRLDILLNGRGWCWRLAGLATLVSVLLSTPRPDVFTMPMSHPENQAVYFKIAQPFAHPFFAGKGSHGEKLTFRITVPLCAHLLGFGLRIAKALEMLAGFLMFYLAAKIIEQQTNDRRLASFGTLLICGLFAGTTAFVEFRSTYDGIAIALLVLAIWAPWSWLVGSAVFLAAWCDERALIASSFVLLYHCFSQGTQARKIVQGLFGWKSLAIMLAWISYFAGRAYLRQRYALPTETGGVGLAVLLGQLNNLPLGLWTAFEGGWAIIIGAVCIMALRRHYLAALAMLGCLAVSIGVAMAVMDITRSMAYLLPGVFVAVGIWSREESRQDLAVVLEFGMLVSLLWPSLYAGGKEGVWWHSPPLPVQALRVLLGT